MSLIFFAQDDNFDTQKYLNPFFFRQIEFVTECRPAPDAALKTIELNATNRHEWRRGFLCSHGNTNQTTAADVSKLSNDVEHETSFLTVTGQSRLQ